MKPSTKVVLFFLILFIESDRVTLIKVIIYRQPLLCEASKLLYDLYVHDVDVGEQKLRQIVNESSWLVRRKNISINFSLPSESGVLSYESFSQIFTGLVRG